MIEPAYRLGIDWRIFITGADLESARARLAAVHGMSGYHVDAVMERISGSPELTEELFNAAVDDLKGSVERELRDEGLDVAADQRDGVGETIGPTATLIMEFVVSGAGMAAGAMAKGAAEEAGRRCAHALNRWLAARRHQGAVRVVHILGPDGKTISTVDAYD